MHFPDSYRGLRHWTLSLKKQASGALYLFALLSVFTVFTRAVCSVRIAEIDFDLFAYPLLSLLFLYGLLTGKFSKRSVMVAVFITAISLANVLLLHYPLDSYLKYLLPVLIIYLGLYNLYRYINLHILFRIYVELAYWSALFGFVQVAAKYFGGVRLLSEYNRLDLHSVAGEPSHYSAILMPALVYAIVMRKQFPMYKTAAMALAMLLTFKLTSYFTFAAAMILAFFNLGHLVLFLAAAWLLYTQYIATNPEFTMRISPILQYFLEGKLPPKWLLHGTPLSFLSNLEAAFYSLSKNPILGVSPGGHESSYFRLFQTREFLGLDYLFGLNARGGHSLSIRLLSETGLVGVAWFVWTLFRNVRINWSSTPYKAVALGCLAHFISKSVKLSSYIDYGTPFFFIVLILIHKSALPKHSPNSR